jgi:hypothetical protein
VIPFNSAPQDRSPGPDKFPVVSLSVQDYRCVPNSHFPILSIHGSHTWHPLESHESLALESTGANVDGSEFGTFYISR